MYKKLLIIALAVVLGISGWFFFGRNIASSPELPSIGEGIHMDDGHEHGVDDIHEEAEIITGNDGDKASDSVINFTGSAYLPSILNVEEGALVTFNNTSGSLMMWPASAMHPTHTVYPGSSIGKCGTGEADSIFDACKSLAPEESFSFIFDEIGEWDYHDHLKPSIGGIVIVK